MLVGGNLALDFVNTIANRFTADRQRDLLGSPAEALSWLNEAGLLASGAGKSLTRDRLQELRDIREELYGVLAAKLAGERLSANGLEHIQERFKALMTHRQLLVTGDNVAWTWRRTAPPLASVHFTILTAALDLLTSSDLSRVRRCEGDGCGWLFVDSSRGGRRKWCVMSDCGNRAKAKRHYARRLRDLAAESDR